jgi:Domain of unknown function (DUF5666)
MKSLLRILVVIVTAGLAGCGGGGGEMVARIGSGGSGAPVSAGAGAVSGFGSIIVNGQHYDETSAQVFVDERPDLPSAASVDAIRLGSQIRFEHQSNRISQATVAAEVIGPVNSVGADALTVLSQTVRVNAAAASPTVFDGFTALTDLTAGSIVEVHGQRNAAGEIVASRIELRPATGVMRVAGTVTSAASDSFKIGTLTVRTAQATVLPAGQTLATGQRVAAWTDQPLANGEFVARVVRIGGTNVPDAAALTLEGVVTDYKAVSSFRVGGYAVDATGAQFVGGTATDLRDGRFVRASGTVNAGVLRATRVEFIAATAPVVEVTGAIANFTDAKSPFSVRNTGTLVTPQTTYTRGDATNLGEGVLVKVEGPLVNGKLEAIKVDFLPPSAGIARVLFGTVTKPSAAADPRTFVLAPLPFEVKTTAATQYKKGVAADLKDGRSVKVAGSYDGLQFIADEIQFMDNAQDAPTFSVAGIASNVQPGSVVVDGKTVTLTPTTSYKRNGVAAKFDDLKNGATVDIEAVKLNGILYAVSVELKELASGSASVRGIVSGRASDAATEFLVGSQRVSVAGSPQIVPGSKSLKDIKNGTDLEVEGTIASGLLTATRVKFR